MRSHFITSLHTDPRSVTLNDVEGKLILFLHQWKTRGVPKRCASALLEAICAVQPVLSALSSFRISNVDFDQQLSISNFNNPPNTVADAIECCYQKLISVKGLGPTATAKILHVLLPELCVMWDDPILKYFKSQHNVSGTGIGYVQFLRLLQAEAQRVIQDFDSIATLNPPRTPNQTLEEYLSAQLSTTHRKTLAKYLDEYYWVTVTNEVSVPPAWHPDI